MHEWKICSWMAVVTSDKRNTLLLWEKLWENGFRFWNTVVAVDIAQWPTSKCQGVNLEHSLLNAQNLDDLIFPKIQNSCSLLERKQAVAAIENRENCVLVYHRQYLLASSYSLNEHSSMVGRLRGGSCLWLLVQCLHCIMKLLTAAFLARCPACHAISSGTSTTEIVIQLPGASLFGFPDRILPPDRIGQVLF